jgi:hypothetical protein
MQEKRLSFFIYFVFFFKPIYLSLRKQLEEYRFRVVFFANLSFLCQDSASYLKLMTGISWMLQVSL